MSTYRYLIEQNFCVVFDLINKFVQNKHAILITESEPALQYISPNVYKVTLARINKIAFKDCSNKE